MTTREAFTHLVNSPYLWKKTGQTKNSRRVHKHRLSQGEWPSIETMEGLLEPVFDVIQQKAWRIRQ